ncbi:MAG TPA: UDP-glucose/GDP-mannose dehydrogenase family protein [Candidatus Baltobacteraceae bacterium]|nr:UDP-glucose/GDP-mannose dehydrogenase family protein [Candidatus Baltobacteraceae bacterium]
MARIAMFGLGYVGLVTGTCFAELGNDVIGYDVDRGKIATLELGRVPIYEPGLAEMIERNVRAKRLRFTRDVGEAVRSSDLIFIAVGTPQGADGHADLSYVRQAAIDIARHLDGPKIVVNKSTVPVETGNLVRALIREYAESDHDVRVVSNPEFVREGSAIGDFMNPDRVVIGCDDADCADVMRSLYQPLGVPIVTVSVRAAEMIKYTANAFLATKISFVNEIANICEQVGADVNDVVYGAGSDRRIGTMFFRPGLGFGGSCFPKDVTALTRIAEEHGVEARVLRSVLDTNAAQIDRCFEKIARDVPAGAQVALLGLAFKADTDDIRESPAIALLRRLLDAGYAVRAHDPIAIPAARGALGDALTYHDDAYACAAGAAATIVATDWNEYKQLDLARLAAAMHGTLVFDLRNLYDLERASAHGLTVVGVGRARAALERPVEDAR